MLILKAIHVFCAYTTGIGFLLRGVLILCESQIMQHQIVKKLPHIIDSGLFISGIFMAFYWAISPAEQPWLLAKLIALPLYILFGLIMIRWGNTDRRRWVGLIGGLLIYSYIVGAAHSKSVLSIFS